MAAERPPGFWTYTAMLGLISVLLSIVGYLSISRFDSFESMVAGMAKEQTAMAKEQADTRREVTALRATLDAWAKQNFVPRDLFDAMKDEYERRLTVLEKKG